MRISLLVICITAVCLRLNSQTADIPLNSEVYHLIDRIDIKGMADTLVHTDIKPYSFSYTAAILKRAAQKAK